MGELSRDATDMFQCCELGGEPDLCQKCQSEQSGFVKRVGEVDMESFPANRVVVEGEAYAVHPSVVLGEGGFSLVFASTKCRTTPRGVPRLQHRASTPEQSGIVLKTSLPSDCDVLRAHLIEYDIGKEAEKVLRGTKWEGRMLGPLGSVFRLEKPYLDPPYLLTTAYPRYDGDLYELMMGGMLSQPLMLHCLAVIAGTIAELQHRIQFMHRDLKFENVFFKLCPAHTGVAPPARGSKSMTSISTPGAFFTIAIADCGMARAKPKGGKKRKAIGADFWASCKVPMDRGGDLCFLTMCLLSADGRWLRRRASEVHSFLWRCCPPVISSAILALRLEDDDPMSDSSEEEPDEEELAEHLEEYGVESDQHDKSMYFLTAGQLRPKVLKHFAPGSFFDGLAGVAMGL